MKAFRFSNTALKNLKHFYSTNLVVYVEGDDDVIFWSEVFKRGGIDRVKFKPKGGKTFLEPYIKSILQEKTDIAVALDSDYDWTVNKKFISGKIFYTYGYSIENSLYCPNVIKRIIDSLARKDVISAEEIEEWFNELTEKLKDILVYDIANFIHQKGIKSYGDNTLRFMRSNNSIFASDSKVESYINSISEHFSPEQILEARNIIQSSNKPLRFLFRGHFLTNAVINFIKFHSGTSTNKINLPRENLFSMTVNQFSSNQCAKDCLISLIKKVKRSYKDSIYHQELSSI